MKAFILTGSRDWTDFDALRAIVQPHINAGHVMIHGAHGCPSDLRWARQPTKSADALASFLYSKEGGIQLPLWAPWEEYKRERPNAWRAAGIDRNAKMRDLLAILRWGGWDLLPGEAFSLPGSRGTPNMKRLIGSLGVAVNEHGRTA